MKYNAIINNARNMEAKRGSNGTGSMYRSSKTNLLVAQYTSRIDNKRKTLYQHIGESDLEFQKRFNETLLMQSKGDTSQIKNVITIDSIVTSYVKQRNVDGYTSPRSFKRAMETLAELEEVCASFVNKPINQITTQDIQLSKVKMQKFSKSTIDKIWNLLQKGFLIAYNRRLIEYNLMLDETLVKPISTKPTKKMEALTLDERKKFRKVLALRDNPIYSDILTLQLNTGMRIGEVLARSFSDVDFVNNTLHIHNTLTQDDNYNTIISDHTKTYNKHTNIDKGERIIPLDAESMEIIRRLYSQNQELKQININNLIFYDYSRNKIINPSQVNSYLNRLNAKYHIRDQLSTHILRHTKVTELQEQHINPVVIHYLVGHTPNSTMTDNVYTSVSLDFVKSEIEYSKKIIAMQ